jgi:hypothetical protein
VTRIDADATYTLAEPALASHCFSGDINVREKITHFMQNAALALIWRETGGLTPQQPWLKVDDQLNHSLH